MGRDAKNKGFVKTRNGNFFERDYYKMISLIFSILVLFLEQVIESFERYVCICLFIDKGDLSKAKGGARTHSTVQVRHANPQAQTKHIALLQE